MWLCATKIWWKAKHCYMDTDSFTVHAKPDDIYKDIVKDVETDLTVQIMS